MTKTELEQYRSIVREIDEREKSGDTALLRRLVEQKRKIEDFIDEIPDSITRRVFWHRYINGSYRPTWTKIARRIGGGNMGDGVRMRHDRYLKNIR